MRFEVINRLGIVVDEFDDLKDAQLYVAEQHCPDLYDIVQDSKFGKKLYPRRSPHFPVNKDFTDPIEEFSLTTAHIERAANALRRPLLPCGCSIEDNDVMRSSVYWNPYNKVVQCHKCGTVYEAKKSFRA